jgi:hypothetical protein
MTKQKVISVPVSVWRKLADTTLDAVQAQVKAWQNWARLYHFIDEFYTPVFALDGPTVVCRLVRNDTGYMSASVAAAKTVPFDPNDMRYSTFYGMEASDYNPPVAELRRACNEALYSAVGSLVRRDSDMNFEFVTDGEELSLIMGAEEVGYFPHEELLLI